MNYVVRRKLWRDPALQTAIAEQEKEDVSKQGRSSAFPNKNKKKQEKNEGWEKHAGRVWHISSCNNATYEGQEDRDEGP
jgi:hypothetical protein